MGTRADFYLGRGTEAKWLGSIAWDGDPNHGHPEKLLKVKSKEKFLKVLKDIEKGVDHWTSPEQGWPWPWEDSCTTDFSYAWHKGKVWITCFGMGWITTKELRAHGKAATKEEKRYEKWVAEGKDPDDFVWEVPDSPWVDGKKVPFPNMKTVQNVALGKRSGLLVIRG
jgi:hypothetical protein